MSARRSSRRRSPARAADTRVRVAGRPRGRGTLGHPALWSFLAGVAIHLPSLPFAFVWDDHYLIERQPLLRSAAGLGRLLTSDFWTGAGQHASGFWRPAIVLSYALDARLWHSATGFRAVNLVAHGVASAALAALGLGAGLSRPAALLVGLAFATLPAHLESVVWIAGRTDVFAAAFGLLALLAERRAGRGGGARWRVAALVALALALLSKESAAALVGVMAVAAWVEREREPRPWGRRLAGLVPAALVTAAYAGFHLAFARGEALPAVLIARMRERAGGGFWLLLPGYLAFLWPGYPHSPAATLDLTPPPGPLAIAGGAALLGGAAVGLTVIVARRSRAAVPWSLAALTLLPVLAVNAWRGTLLFAERFFYLPSAGVVWALATHAQSLPRAARRAAFAIAALLVLAGAWRTLALEPDWADDETLFRSMTRLQPANVTGHLQLARELDRQGREAEAEQAAVVAERLDPTRPDVVGLGAVLALRGGQPDRALALADRAIAGGSLQLEPRLTRAAALAALGRSDQALAAIDTLRANLPGNPAVESLWGQVLVATGHAAEAVPVLEGAGRLLPGDVDVIYALGMARVALRDWSGAEAAFGRAVELRPGYYEAWLQLGAARLQHGERSGAAVAFAAATRLPQAADGRAAGLLRMVTGGR